MVAAAGFYGFRSHIAKRVQRGVIGRLAENLRIGTIQRDEYAMTKPAYETIDRELLTVWALGCAAAQASASRISPFGASSVEDIAWRHGWDDGLKSKLRTAQVRLEATQRHALEE
jgi:hypothetical protein